MTEFRLLTLQELLVDNESIPSLPFQAVLHKPHLHLTAQMGIQLGMPSHAQAFIQEVMLCNSNMPSFPAVPL